MSTRQKMTVEPSGSSWIWPGYASWPSLLAVVVLLLNDHVAKGAGVLPTWMTGKLSDVAGLFFFPLLLGALLHLAGRFAGFRLSRLQLAVCAVLTGLVFASIQLSEHAATAYTSALGSVPILYASAPAHTMDGWDLVALPMVGLAFWWGSRHVPSSSSSH